MSKKKPLHKCRVKGCTHEDEWCDRNRDRCDSIVLDPEDGSVRQCKKPTTWLSQGNSAFFPLAYCDEHIENVPISDEIRRLRDLVDAANDFRVEIAVDAFTAPDADWLTILDSLRARINDLNRAQCPSPSPHETMKKIITEGQDRRQHEQ